METFFVSFFCFNIKVNVVIVRKFAKHKHKQLWLFLIRCSFSIYLYLFKTDFINLSICFLSLILISSKLILLYQLKKEPSPCESSFVIL